ncbi:hypothetical protein ACFLYH_00200 [Candidatus Dependentiae bacterium]
MKEDKKNGIKPSKIKKVIYTILKNGGFFMDSFSSLFFAGLDDEDFSKLRNLFSNFGCFMKLFASSIDNKNGKILSKTRFGALLYGFLIPPVWVAFFCRERDRERRERLCLNEYDDLDRERREGLWANEYYNFDSSDDEFDSSDDEFDFESQDSNLPYSSTKEIVEEVSIEKLEEVFPKHDFNECPMHLDEIKKGDCIVTYEGCNHIICKECVGRNNEENDNIHQHVTNNHPFCFYCNMVKNGLKEFKIK